MVVLHMLVGIGTGLVGAILTVAAGYGLLAALGVYALAGSSALLLGLVLSVLAEGIRWPEASSDVAQAEG